MNNLERGQLHERVKPDFNLISVDGRVVPLGLDPLGSPNESDLVQCSSTALQSDHQQPDRDQETSSLSKQGVICKVSVEANGVGYIKQMHY